MTEAQKKWSGYSALYAVEQEKEKEARAFVAPLDERLPVGVTTTPGETTPRQKASPGQKAARTQNAGATPAVSRRPPPERQPLPETPPVLPSNEPHLRLPYVVIDRLRLLRPAARVIAEEIYRAAAGWHSDECVISIGKLSLYVNIDPKHLRRHLAALERGGYIERLGDVTGGSDLSARGIRFRILLPRMTRPQKATPGETGGGDKRPPNKEKALKENNKKGINRLAPEEIRSFTSTVADLLGEGQTIEEVEARFAPNMHAVDWATIRSTALAQVAPKKGK